MTMSTGTPQGPDTGAESAQPIYSFDIPLSEVGSAPIKGFDTYWRSKMKDGRLPSRDDIDPAEIVPLLPDIVLLNVEWEPFRCRVRLRGTRAEQFRPIDTTKYIDSSTIFDPGRREDYIAEMKFVATGNRPAFARDWMTTRFGAVREIFAGIWPLAADGTHVDMLVVIEDFAGLSLDDFAIQ
jgi:hypothetical protein